MRFWDSSAIVPLVVEEVASRACRQHLRADQDMVVWCLTRTEVLSALCRRRREGGLSPDDLERAERRLDRFAAHWDEVDGVLPVRDSADRLLRVHALRAGDAIQLAAALVLFDHRPRRRPFVSLDAALSAAAAAEGFEVIVPRG